MNIFDLEKLEKQKELLDSMHTVEPTTEFIIAEMEKCKDPVYVFEHYWAVNGKAPTPTQVKDFAEYMKFISHSRFHYMRKYVTNLEVDLDAIIHGQIVSKGRRSRK